MTNTWFEATKGKTKNGYTEVRFEILDPSKPGVIIGVNTIHLLEDAVDQFIDYVNLFERDEDEQT